MLDRENRAIKISLSNKWENILSIVWNIITGFSKPEMRRKRRGKIRNRIRIIVPSLWKTLWNRIFLFLLKLSVCFILGFYLLCAREKSLFVSNSRKNMKTRKSNFLLCCTSIFVDIDWSQEKNRFIRVYLKGQNDVSGDNWI